MFEGLKLRSFTKKELQSLKELFCLLGSDKRLNILSQFIAVDSTSIPEVSTKNIDTKTVMHVKKLSEYGLLEREDDDTNVYRPLASDETYIFLRIALLFDSIIRIRSAEQKIISLKTDAERVCEKIATSPIVKKVITSLKPPHVTYNDSLEKIHEIHQAFMKRYTQLINVREL